MITAATLMQRIPARMMILLAVFVAAVTAAVALVAAFHGVPFHGVPFHDAMSFNGPKNEMSFN